MARVETLKWGGMPHSFVLTEDEQGLRGKLTIVKPKGTQEIDVVFPEQVNLQMVLDAWKGNWVDLFEPVRKGDLFSVIRVIDMGEWRVFWVVLHVADFPQDNCFVLKKP